MRNIIICCIVLLLQLQLVSMANAASENPVWKTCLDMQSKESAESELNCYRQAAQKPEARAARKTSLVPIRARGLVKEWEPTNDPLNAYKQNYALLYSHSSLTNNAPTSPNPQNQVLTPSPLENRDLKFQISLKHDLADFQEYGSLWFGYTQLSFWQVYDAASSRPFRENNYEPELIYSLRSINWKPVLGLTPGIVNFGLVHQSNGQSNPRSRSWNRVYIQPGLERSFDGDNRLTVQMRWWYRIKEDSSKDDNPDIAHFLGRGDIEVSYSQGELWEISVLGKARSTQLDWAMPWPSWLPFPSTFRSHNTNIHMQYFSGYGESLIDYNHKHDSWGAGLTFPFN